MSADAQATRVVVGPPSLHGASHALRLPLCGRPASFLLVPGDPPSLLELNRHQAPFTSFLIGDAVQEDGSVYVATPCDVLFLLLPALEREKVRGWAERPATGFPPRRPSRLNPSPYSLSKLRFVSAEQLLDDNAYPALAALGGAAARSLPCVCSVRLVGGDAFYRLDEARLVAWLGLKAAAAGRALRTQPCGAASYDGLDDASLLAYSLDLLGEYVAPHWVQRARRAEGLPPAAGGAEPGAAAGAAGWGAAAAPAAAAAAAGDDDGPRAAKKAKPSAAEQRAAKARETQAAKNAKAAAGSRPLASFFSPPAKPKPT